MVPLRGQACQRASFGAYYRYGPGRSGARRSASTPHSSPSRSHIKTFQDISFYSSSQQVLRIAKIWLLLDSQVDYMPSYCTRKWLDRLVWETCDGRESDWDTLPPTSVPEAASSGMKIRRQDYLLEIHSSGVGSQHISSCNDVKNRKTSSCGSVLPGESTRSEVDIG